MAQLPSPTGKSFEATYSKMQKILLIGNGPSAASMRLGKEIDEFDGDVVRFNTYRIKGNEKHVGTRTDRWIATDIFPAWHKEYKEVILCNFSRKPDNPLVLKMKTYYPEAHNFPEWAWQETMKLMNFSAPSSGAVAAMYFKDKQVYIYGFDFFSGKKHHYGDNLNACHHNARKEVEYFTKLMSSGKVVPFHDYLRSFNYEILHKACPEYGVGGNWFGNKIISIAKEQNVKTILDYGCGKGGLVNLLKKDYEVYGYDPYVPEFSRFPEVKIDMLVSTDFLEHIEEDELDDILSHFNEIAPKVQFHAISNRKAAQILPDGRNAHRIVRPAEWWTDKLGILGHVTYLGHNDIQNFSMYEVT